MIFDDEGLVEEVLYYGFNPSHTSDPEGELAAAFDSWVSAKREQLRGLRCPEV